MRNLILLTLLVLAACGSRTSVDRTFNALDPLTLDPATLQVITEHAAAAGLRGFGTVTLAIEDTEPVLTRVFPLVAQSEQEMDGILRRVFALSPVDVSRFQALQRDITVLKLQGGQDLKGSFAVEAGACRFGPPSEGPVPFRVWVQPPGAAQPVLVFETSDVLAQPAMVHGREVCET